MKTFPSLAHFMMNSTCKVFICALVWTSSWDLSIVFLGDKVTNVKNGWYRECKVNEKPCENLSQICASFSQTVTSLFSMTNGQSVEFMSFRQSHCCLGRYLWACALSCSNTIPCSTQRLYFGQMNQFLYGIKTQPNKK